MKLSVSWVPAAALLGTALDDEALPLWVSIGLALVAMAVEAGTALVTSWWARRSALEVAEEESAGRVKAAAATAWAHAPDEDDERHPLRAVLAALARRVIPEDEGES